jgi:hypothetical protein
MSQPRTSRIGPLLVVIGFLMLLAQLGLPGFGKLWPLLLVALGVGLLVLYFTGEGEGEEGLLFNGILGLLFGLFFQCVEWEWIRLGRHWPFFLFAPGVALAAVSLMSRRKRAAIIPATLLMVVSFILYLFTTRLFVILVRLIFQILLPIGLVLLGAWLTLGGRLRRRAAPQPALPEKIEPPQAARPGAPGAPGESLEP